MDIPRGEATRNLLCRFKSQIPRFPGQKIQARLNGPAQPVFISRRFS
jgi:hypothetical protein